MTGIKILMLDIETAPNKVYTWGLWNQTVGINQIVEPGYTLCWAAKWYGEAKKKARFRSVFHDGAKLMLEDIWELLDEADAVVHYNGKNFDIPTLNREFIKHDMLPPSPYYQIDLLQIVRSKFKFASNKLDYVSQQLGLGAKVQNKGMDLWHECMEGDEKAWRQMKRYNLRDTTMLDKLYEKLLPWIARHPNMALWTDASKPTCPNCGGTHLNQRGTRKTRVLEYLRYRCMDCGTWSKSRKRIAPAQDGVLT